MAHRDIIDKEFLKAVCNRIKKEIKKIEKTKDKHDLEKCIQEIDFNYYFLRRYNNKVLPFSSKEFQELDKEIEKIKNKMRLII